MVRFDEKNKKNRERRKKRYGMDRRNEMGVESRIGRGKRKADFFFFGKGRPSINFSQIQ
jgi:hypothetical protein